MNQKNSAKWTSCAMVVSMLCDVKKFCKNSKNGFTNPSQFIAFAVRKELDFRKCKK